MASKLETFVGNVMTMAQNIAASIKVLNTFYTTRSITINGTVFFWAKKPDNNTSTLAIGEVISHGRISNAVHINYAIYNGGDINNFGTVQNDFTDGNYTVDYILIQ